MRFCIVHEPGIKIACLEETLDFFSFLGWSCFFDALDLRIFLESADMPDLEKIVSNKDTEVVSKVHFLQRVRSFSSKRVRQASRFASCSFGARLHTKLLW